MELRPSQTQTHILGMSWVCVVSRFSSLPRKSLLKPRGYPPVQTPSMVRSSVFTLFARPAWVGFFFCASSVRKWRRAALRDVQAQPIAWQCCWPASQWRSGPAAGRRRDEAQSGQGGGAVEWRTAGLARPGGSEPRGPEETAAERGEYERGERRLLGPPRPPLLGGGRRRRWGGPLGPCQIVSCSAEAGGVSCHIVSPAGTPRLGGSGAGLAPAWGRGEGNGFIPGLTLAQPLPGATAQCRVCAPGRGWAGRRERAGLPGEGTGPCAGLRSCRSAGLSRGLAGGCCPGAVTEV